MTGVQTCALPILNVIKEMPGDIISFSMDDDHRNYAVWSIVFYVSDIKDFKSNHLSRLVKFTTGLYSTSSIFLLEDDSTTDEWITLHKK